MLCTGHVQRLRIGNTGLLLGTPLDIANIEYSITMVKQASPTQATRTKAQNLLLKMLIISRNWVVAAQNPRRIMAGRSMATACCKLLFFLGVSVEGKQ